MEYQIFSSIAFSLCALFFELFIIIMYINKKKYKNTENTIFLFLLFFTSILIFTEMGYVTTLSRSSTDSTSVIFMCRLYLNSLIIWLVSFMYYVFVLITKDLEIEVKKKRRKRILYILGGLCAISMGISNMLDIEFFDYTNHIYSFTGDATYVPYFLALVLVIILVYGMVFNNYRIKSGQRKPILFSIILLVITTLLQFFIESFDYNIQNFQFVVILMSLYFTFENQDVKLLEEHEIQKTEAEKANKEQTDFLTSMSHEIRTPMNTIMGFSEVIIREGAEDEAMVKKDTTNIHIAAVTLLELINNILDLSRIESGKESIVEKEYDLQNLMVELNDLIYSKINKEKVKFSIRIDESLPRKYNGDYTKLFKILSNVLINTIYYTKQGSILFDVRKLVTTDNRLILQLGVYTEGSYIIKEDFVKYYTDGTKEDNKINSVALGITVARQYAKMLNTNLVFNSVNGRNISYMMQIEPQVTDTLPIGNIQSLLTETASNQHKINLESRNILVVDDNQLNIKLINRLLVEYKVNIDSATNGMECVEKASDKNYDLIFLDHMMPGMDGIETIHKLQDTIKNLPPVIALTANSYAGIRDMYLGEGFTDYLAKPINRNDLNRLLFTIFNNK